MFNVREINELKRKAIYKLFSFIIGTSIYQET